MRLRATFSKKHLLGILLALSAVASVTGERLAHHLRHVAGFLLPPVSDVPMYAVTQIGSRISADRGGEISAAEAEELRRENDYLRRLAAYWRYREEVYRKRSEDLTNFQRMYGPTRDLACELIPARVVAAGSLPYDATRVLTRSSRREIRVGSPVTTRLLVTDRSKVLPPRLAVVHANFLVGRITASGAFTARLQLLTDRGFQVRGRIRRIIAGKPRMITVTEGDLPRTTLLTPETNDPIDVVARGDGAGRLVVADVKDYHRVRKGDLLVASASHGYMPTEIDIGTVVEVSDPGGEGRVKLTVQPHADLTNIRDVYILSPVEPPPDAP